MSMWTQVRLNIVDKDVLKEALDELGYDYDESEEAKSLNVTEREGQNLKAQIRLKGRLSNVGFMEENGKWDIVGASGSVSAIKGGLMQEVNQIYGEKKFRKQMKTMGYLVDSRQKQADGRIRMKVMVP